MKTFVNYVNMRLTCMIFDWYELNRQVDHAAVVIRRGFIRLIRELYRIRLLK